MSIELSRKYLDVTVENKEDQVRSFLNDESCEKHFETGYDNFGPDEICLNNDVFLIVLNGWMSKL